MRVLVTGANGMIGLATVMHFLERGYQVAALVRNMRATTWIDLRADIQVLDSDWGNLQDVCSGCDAVVHLAAQRPQPEYEERGIEAYWLPNVLLTDRLLRAAAAAGVKRFSFASTGSVYSSDNSSPYREIRLSLSAKLLRNEQACSRKSCPPLRPQKRDARQLPAAFSSYRL